MGCVGTFFSKKPGGSLFGNIARLGLDYLTGGIYSTVNPTMDCRLEASGGLVAINGTGGFFGCGGSGYAFRGGFLGDVYDAFHDVDYEGTPIVDPINTVIPTTSGNIFNLPDSVIGIVNELLNGLDAGTIDINNIPDSIINVLDAQITDPNQIEALANHLGLDANLNVIENQLGHPWQVSGTIGGVTFGVGTPDNEESAFSQFQTKAYNWIKSTTGIIVMSSVGVAVAGYFGYKYYFKKRR